MEKKKNIPLSLIVTLALAAALALSLIPQFAARLRAESENKGVVISLLYSDIRNRLGDEKLSEYLDLYAQAGVNTVSLPEDTVSVLVSRGDVIGLRYSDIRHKYDTETVEIEEMLDGVPGIGYSSHVFIVKRRNMIERLDEWLPLYYTNADYVKVGEISGMAVYVFFDGNTPTYDIPVGYDEDAMAELDARGFDIALVMRVGAHTAAGYIEKTGELVSKYNVKYYNLKSDSYSVDTDSLAEENARGIAELVGEHKLTLVLTERDDQLSNVRPVGYSDIFAAADGRVMRSYETYDHTGADETGYMFRVREYMNSVVDRNIRFITVTQLALGGKSNEHLAADTLDAVTETVAKLDSIGYEVGHGDVRFEYDRSAYVPAAAISFAVLTGMAALAAVFDLDGRGFCVLSILLAAGAFGMTFMMPRTLLLLYPTALALVTPCLAAALALLFVRCTCGRIGQIVLVPAVTAIMLITVAAGGFVMASLTSGLDYYINNDIFRGIKISLYAPLVFTFVSYYFMFIYRRGGLPADIKALFTARVRVWWCFLFAAVAAVSFIYILRSGNVDSISSAEEAMRNFISEHFPARPRTKEFLAAYPCAALFAWYSGRDERHIAPWLFAVGAAILPASVMNTFCHVFTDVSVQYGRLVNGLLIGVFTSSAALVLNCAFLALYRRVIRTIKDE